MKRFCFPNWQRDYKQWLQESLRYLTLTWTQASLNFCHNKHDVSGRDKIKFEIMLFTCRSKESQLVNSTNQSFSVKKWAGNEVLRRRTA